MTDHVEDRLLKLAEKGIAAGSYSEDGALYTLAVTGKRGPAIVAAMCRVVAATRHIGHHNLCDYVNALGECDCQIGTALAALDAMEEKAE